MGLKVKSFEIHKTYFVHIARIILVGLMPQGRRRLTEG